MCKICEEQDRLVKEIKEDLEGKCLVLRGLAGVCRDDPPVCDCEEIQGNLNCKLNPF